MVLQEGIVGKLAVVQSAEAEVELLQELRSQLLPQSPKQLNSSTDDFIEQQWLAIASSQMTDNPFPMHKVVEYFSNYEELQVLTCYMFDRRYGWSEVASPERGKTGLQKTKLKTSLNGYLDEFIKW